VYSRDTLGSATAGYDNLSMATAGVYWMSWWSSTKYHIKTFNDFDELSWTWIVPVSVNNFFPPLCHIMLLHFKNRQLFLAHPVYVTIINVTVDHIMSECQYYGCINSQMSLCFVSGTSDLFFLTHR